MAFVSLSLIVLSLFQQASSLMIPRQCPEDTVKPVAAGYYADWHSKEGFPLSDILWDKYNVLLYSFAATTPNVNNLSLTTVDASLLPAFVSQAHQHDVAAHVAIGGWSGSRYFSSSVATPENRTAFVNTIATFADDFGVDGIQFDWEYPNNVGIGCNTINRNDTQNFLAFLQELRTNSVGANLTLSAATSVLPFLDGTGSPSKDVSGFARVLDYIAIMNYDVWGSWSPFVGPNAPLNDTCASPADQQGSAVSAVKAWNDAGMPLDKIVLNVAAYGHSFNVLPADAFGNGSTSLVAYPKFNASNQPLGDSWDDTGSTNVCGAYQPHGGTYHIWSLVEDGFLTEDGQPAPGIFYRYDECSQTPYVYNKTSEIMVSFDDAQSFTAKGNFIKQSGLRGFAMWEAGGDYHNILLDTIREGAGYS